jgi:hypothetical protein
MMTSRRVGLFRRNASRQHGEDFTWGERRKSAPKKGAISVPRHAAAEAEFRLFQLRSASLRWRRHSARRSFTLEAAAFLK